MEILCYQLMVSISSSSSSNTNINNSTMHTTIKMPIITNERVQYLLFGFFGAIFGSLKSHTTIISIILTIND